MPPGAEQPLDTPRARGLVVSAVGLDRPGIVAAIAEPLASRGLNISDSQMGILRGHFVMTLVAESREAIDVESLRAELGEVGRDLGLEALAVQPLGAGAPASADVATHTVSVYGADHPGIVASVARALADAQVNVVDLRTRLGEDGLYVMVMEVAAPASVDPAELLRSVAVDQAVDVAVAGADADVL
jgi:glycine cleavage system transcriptional repressor